MLQFFSVRTDENEVLVLWKWRNKLSICIYEFCIGCVSLFAYATDSLPAEDTAREFSNLDLLLLNSKLKIIHCNNAGLTNLKMSNKI